MGSRSSSAKHPSTCSRRAPCSISSPCRWSHGLKTSSPWRSSFTNISGKLARSLTLHSSLVDRACTVSWTSVYLCYSKADLAENARQGLNKLLASEVPIEIKPVNPPHFYRPAATQPKQLFWVRARGYIGNTAVVYI